MKNNTAFQIYTIWRKGLEIQNMYVEIKIIIGKFVSIYISVIS